MDLMARPEARKSREPSKEVKQGTQAGGSSKEVKQGSHAMEPSKGPLAGAGSGLACF